MGRISAGLAAILLIILALWGVSGLTSPAPKRQAHPDNGSVDVMKMMQESKDLPEQRFDAF